MWKLSGFVIMEDTDDIEFQEANKNLWRQQLCKCNRNVESINWQDYLCKDIRFTDYSDDD